MINRRAFVRAAGAALAAAPLSRLMSQVPRPKSALTRIGLELYSVRDAMKANPERTLEQVRAIGYDDVELLWSFSNFGRTPQQVRATLDGLGLGAPSAHISPDALREDWEKSLDTAKYLGHRYLIVPSLPSETRRSLDAWRVWADIFNNAGQIANKAGVWLAFHNEPMHQTPIEGQIPYDLFLDRTDPSVVRHQLDIGNMTLGGGDPMRYLQKYGNRYYSFHIKDAAAGGAGDTELGKGTIGIARFLAAVPELDDKPCYVEQESPVDAMASAKQNYEYLRALQY